MRKRHFFTFLFFSLMFSVNFIKAQNTFTFTNAGATGSLGPTQSMVNASYSTSSLNGLVSVSLGIQSWTVPFTGNYRIEAVGAAGGTQSYSPGYPGGLGASVRGDFSLTAGTVLKILVGQKGEDTRVNTEDNAAPGGGGGSFVYISPTSSLPLLAAGGGAGGGRNPLFQHATISTTANPAAMGALGGNNGNGGQINNSGFNYYAGGGAGWLSDGTGGGSASLYTYTPGTYGAFGGRSPQNGGQGGLRYNDGFDEGGDGGFGGGGGGGSDNMGTGGGGGFSGGGGANGGTSTAGNPTGGGGGSYNGGVNQVNTASVNAGHGYVIVTRLSGVSLTQIGIINCNGQLSGALSASVTGGTAPYSYSWSPGGSNTSSITGLGPGTYTCRVTDAASVVYVSTFVITQPAILSSAVAAQINNQCFGGVTGAATITTIGGTGPYSYTWVPTGGFSASANGLASGNYTVQIKDANNCVNYTTVSITQGSPLNVLAFAVNSTVCAGNTTTLLAAGALNYVWSGGVTNGVGFAPAVSSVYTVIGTDANGCIGNNTITIVVNPSPTISLTGPNTVCSGSNISLSASGATSYIWSTGASSNGILVSPTVNASYTVFGTNAFGCTATAIKNISVLSLPSVSASVSSNSICAGYPVVAFASGANTYSWTGGIINGVAFTPTVTNTYTVTGIDLNGCSNNFVTTISITPAPNITISGNSLICQGSNITLSASGAQSYTWSIGAITASVNVSPTTTTVYSITGINASGCSANAFKTVLVSGPPTLSIVSTNTSVCDGIPLTLLAVGSASSYTWLPSNSNALYLTVTPSVSTGYTLIGINSAGCVQSISQLIGVNNAPNVAINSATSICAGSSVTLTVTGAVSYTWQNGLTSQSIVVNPASLSVYSVTGVAANGCTKFAHHTIVVEPLPNVLAFATSTNICVGAIGNLIATGANSYTWLPINVSLPTVTVSPSINTTYTLIGKSVSGCANSSTVNVNVVPAPSVVINGLFNICAGQNATLTAGGASTYTWSNATNGSVNIVSPSVSSNYSVFGTNAIGCMGSAALTVTVLPLPLLTVLGNTNICAGSLSTLSASGANSYTWQSGVTTNSVLVSANNNTIYSVSGSDANHCIGSTSVLVLVNSLPNVSIAANNTLVCVGEAVELRANGAGNYVWSNGSQTSQISVSPTVSGSYSVSGVGSNSCTNSAAITISVSACAALTNHMFELDLLRVFPNPNNGRFTITTSIKADLELFNALGEKLRTIQADELNEESVELMGLKTGLYFISLKSSSGFVTKKIVVKE